ncbi:MAG: DegT/DnrJ/EryC1/StrS family aminotransferase, partial [Pseudomonadota bacterium]
RVHGKGKDKYDNVRIGMNSRLDTMQAAILIEKLSVFAEEIEARNKVADGYETGLSAIVKTPTVAPGNTSVWAQYTLTLDGERDAVAATLKQQGIPTAIYYPMPLHQQSAYSSFPIAGNGLPVCEHLSRHVLSLPMHPYMGQAEQARVIDGVQAALG